MLKHQHNLIIHDSIIIIAIFFSVWCLRIFDLSSYPIPTPIVHDEFSNYLGAETFASGKITNPSNEFLKNSLAEINVLPEPTRMTKYQPAMAGFMAIGIIIFKNAYWGVVLLTSLAIAASYWAIRGWTGKITALSIAIILIFIFRAPHYWINSYWGASHTMLGTLLLIGSYPRIIYKKQYHHTWLAMLGVVILILSRIYEGSLLIISLLICSLLYIRKYFNKEEIRAFITQNFLPIFTVTALLFFFQLSYNKAITESYLTLPYQLYQKQRDPTPPFWLLPQNHKLTSEHYGLRSIQNWEQKDYLTKSIDQIYSILPLTFSEIVNLTRFLDWRMRHLHHGISSIIIFLLHPLLFYLNVIKNKKFITLHTCLIVQLLGNLMITWMIFPHYLAIYFTTYLILIAVNIHSLYYSTKRKIIKLSITAAIVIFPLIFALFPIPNYIGKSDNLKLKLQITATLNNQPGKHLIFVDQHLEAEDKIISYSFIRNGLNLDESKIIWAWHLSEKENNNLINFYKDRQVWYVESYKEKILKPYSNQNRTP